MKRETAIEWLNRMGIKKIEKMNRNGITVEINDGRIMGLKKERKKARVAAEKGERKCTLLNAKNAVQI